MGIKEFFGSILKKLSSSKFIITIWVMIIISYIVFNRIADFQNVAIILSTVPLSYFGANVLLDKIWKNN
jgi:Cu/Ag efflux pump CusA